MAIRLPCTYNITIQLPCTHKIPSCMYKIEIRLDTILYVQHSNLVTLYVQYTILYLQDNNSTILCVLNTILYVQNNHLFCEFVLLHVVSTASYIYHVIVLYFLFMYIFPIIDSIIYLVINFKWRRANCGNCCS